MQPTNLSLFHFQQADNLQHQALKISFGPLNYQIHAFSRPEICKIKFSKTLPAYKIFNSSLLAGRKSFHRRLFFCLQQIESSFYSFLYAQNFTTLYNSVYSSLLICKIIILVGKKSATQTLMQPTKLSLFHFQQADNLQH